jgi:hypothetical protein
MRHVSTGIALIASASLLAAGCASPFYMGQQPSTKHRIVGPRTPGEQFAGIQTVAVVPAATKPTLDISGDYLRAIPSAGQAAAASTAEATSEMIDVIMFEDPRVILVAPIILPLVAIAGAITAKAQQHIQKIRDEITVNLADNAERTKPSDALAEVLETRMYRVPQVDATLFGAGDTLPDDIDAILEVNVTDMINNVRGDNATLTTQATAALSRPSDGMTIFRKEYQYSVKEDLGRWARNDYELLQDYGNGAKHHLARLISDEFFGKVRLRHVLRPVKSGKRQALTWELILLGEEGPNTWANAISESDASFELEIYNGSTLAFAANNLTTTQFDLPGELQPCTSFHWTVRPVYQFEGTARAGEWMAHESAMRRMYGSLNGTHEQLAIREITDGYPEFKTRCR